MHWWPNFIIWAITTPVAIWEVIRKLEIFWFWILEINLFKLPNIMLHWPVGIWLVRMTLHKICRGIFFHDHMMHYPLGMLKPRSPLKSTFVTISISIKLTSNKSKKNSRKFHSLKSLKFSTWTTVTAELNLLLLLFIQQIEILENHLTSWSTPKLFKLKLSLELDFHIENE